VQPMLDMRFASFRFVFSVAKWPTPWFSLFSFLANLNVTRGLEACVSPPRDLQSISGN